MSETKTITEEGLRGAIARTPVMNLYKTDGFTNYVIAIWNALPEEETPEQRFIRKVADLPDDAMLGSAPRRVLELIRARAQNLLEPSDGDG